MSQETALLEQGAGAPSDFANESPFRKKARKKDPAESALRGLAIAGIVLSLVGSIVAYMTLA